MYLYDFNDVIYFKLISLYGVLYIASSYSAFIGWVVIVS